MAKINDIQILDDTELENVVGGDMGKKMKKKFKSLHKQAGDKQRGVKKVPKA